jgi:predicted permease
MFLREIAIAWRKLARRPGAAFLAVASLTLAIGCSTAAFSVVDAYYWRALPVEDPAGLVYAAATDREGRNDQINWPEYEAISQQRGALAGITFENRRGPAVKLADRDDFPITAGVSNNYFEVLGVNAALGRVFHPSDAAEGQVVLSDYYWRTAFGGDLAICGRTIDVGGAALAVIGVLPPGFPGMQRGIRVDLFVPEPVMFGSLRFSSRANPKGNDFQPILRLKPGASLEAARRDMDQALRRVEDAGLAPGPGRKAFLLPFNRPSVKPEMNTGDLFPWIALLVLTVAAANFANLRLVENQARRRETGIRLALGAGRISLLRQHFTETFLVAGTATGLGLLLAEWLIDLAPALLYAGQRYRDYFVRLDARAFAFSGGAMLLVAALGVLIPMRDSWKCGIVPALQATRSPSASRWLAGLVLVQIALITAVSYTAGLLWQSRTAAAAIRPAMDPNRNMLLITGGWRAGGPALLNLSDGLARELSAIPGVAGVAYGRRVMMAGSGGGQRVAFERSGQPLLTFRFNQVSPNYFAATGARVLAGRAFSQADGPNAAPVAMVSQAFVRKFFPQGNALYSWARIGGKDRQIVGIVEDGPSHHLKEEIEPFFYFPFAQRPSGDITYFVDAAVDAARLAAPARERIRNSGGAFAATDFFTLAQHLRGQRREEELAADVSGGLALLGLALAAAGLFGVTLYAVGRRMREFGVRVAMGATPAALGGQVIREALRIAAAGVALGGILSWAGVRLLRTYLAGVKPADLPTFVSAAAVVTLVALVSAVIPARRAAKADPMAALRVE